MTASALNRGLAIPGDDHDGSSVWQGALRFLGVLAAHGAVAWWLLQSGLVAAPEFTAMRLDVRTIEAPPSPALPQALPTAPPAKPKAMPVRSQPTVEKPQAEPLLMANEAGAASAFAAAPQPAAQPMAPAAMEAPVVPSAPAAAAVTQARFDADYLNNPAPQYPLTSRMMKEQGTVLLLVNVTALGDAERVRLHQSSGKSRLDEAALEAVRHWRFVPAKRGEQAIAASVIVPIVFELDR